MNFWKIFEYFLFIQLFKYSLYLEVVWADDKVIRILGDLKMQLR
jgi:hypothetical protein